MEDTRSIVSIHLELRIVNSSNETLKDGDTNDSLFRLNSPSNSNTIGNKLVIQFRRKGASSIEDPMVLEGGYNKISIICHVLVITTVVFPSSDSF